MQKVTEALRRVTRKDVTDPMGELTELTVAAADFAQWALVNLNENLRRRAVDAAESLVSFTEEFEKEMRRPD